MKDFLEKAVSLSLGALVVTREKVEAVVDELVERGKVERQEGEKLVKELLKKGKEGRKELEAQIEKVVKVIARQLDLPSRKEFNELKSKIEKLTKKIK